MATTFHPEWHELCATFSVRDHVHPGAFIAEALLFDRLIIPVVPTEADGLSKEEAGHEWMRWKEKGWQPARQGQITGILQDKLKDRVVLVPWTKELQAEWAGAMNRVPLASGAAAQDESIENRVSSEVENAHRDGYYISGGVIQRFAPKMAKTVVAVSPYRSLRDLETRTRIRRLRPEQRVPASSLMAVLGFELFVPQDPDKDDFQLLAEAAEAASDNSYRERRTTLYLWQQRFIRGGATDAASIRAAVETMQSLVEAMRGAKKWDVARTILSFFKSGKEAASLAAPTGAKVAGALISLGEFGLQQVGDDRSDPLGGPAASLVLDAQERLDLVGD